MYRALIVEDDAQAADTLRSHLERYANATGQRFQVARLSSALELLEGNWHADVLFLDIQMPGINGMEAAEVIRQTDAVTPIVFVTDLAQYAVRGYQVDALDFMVKPVGYEDFALRMGRVMRALARSASSSVQIPLPGGGVRVVSQRDVLYVEILRHDLYWHVAGEPEPLRVRGSLSETHERLGTESFCRVSASHLINMAQVKLVRQGGVVLSDGTEVAFSRSKKKAALEELARFAGSGA